MGFAQAVHGHHRQIRCQGSGGDVLQAIHHQPVVDLVGENNKIVHPSHIQHLLQHFRVIQHTGGVVGVDDHHSPGLAGDLAAQVGNIRIPERGLVTAVEHRLCPGQPDGIAP